MKNRFVFYCFVLITCSVFSACEKWTDKPADDLGLKSRYCNNPAAINFNHGYPGIEDSTVCVFPADPFVGNYSFQDSVYINADTAVLGPLINFDIVAKSRLKLLFNNFCSNSNQLFFTANRYYRAETDSIIGAGTQLMCRTQDTLIGTLDYRQLDSSIYLEFKVITDTGTVFHRGRAYKK